MEPTTVYQYFAVNGALIYVGITNRGIKRLHEHADSKAWWQLATGCTLEHFETREAALAREEELIRRYRPPYNTQHNPDREKPLDQRVAERLRYTGGPKPDIAPDTLKQRRDAWYKLSRAERLVAPCIECGQRPGLTGPSCIPCRQFRDRYREPAKSIFRQYKRELSARNRERFPELVEAVEQILTKADGRSDKHLFASEKRAVDALIEKLRDGMRPENQSSTPEPDLVR